VSTDAITIDRALMRKTIVGLFLILLLSTGSAWLLKDPLITVSDAFFERFGLMGLFIGTLIADISPLPVTHEPLTFLGIAAGIPTPTLLVTLSAASILSGPLGWFCGRLFVSGTPFASWLDRRYPEFINIMRHNGLKAVAITAVLPGPFAMATWTAGMLHLPLHKVAVISLLRIVKVVVYFFFLKLGWLAGGG